MAFPLVSITITLTMTYIPLSSMTYDTSTQGGSFPTLINALHASDISEHAHPQVLLVYFELCVRYLNLCTPASLQRVAEVLCGPRGLRHPDKAVRARAAYSMKGVADGFDFKAYLLLSHVNTFAGK